MDLVHCLVRRLGDNVDGWTQDAFKHPRHDHVC